LAILKESYLSVKNQENINNTPPIEEMANVVREEAAKPLPELEKRPPVLFGIFLIIVGFAFQIVGSWPT